jgi:hypothetical protein
MAYKFNKHVIVVGSARSGTSWLSETLAQPYRYRLLFEPEQETQTKKGYLLCDRWITETETSKAAFKYLTKIFKNRVDCNWIAQNSNRKFKRHLWPFVPKKIIIKFVRCNLSAQYMSSEFGIPVIHIIRNPYDVIRSQQQVKFPWLYDLNYFLQQEELVNLIARIYNYDIHNYKSLSEVQILALRWCIENVIPIEEFKNYTEQITVVRYEELSNDINYFYDICRDFNLEVDPNLPLKYRQPSSKTHPESYTYKRNLKTNILPESTLREINRILDAFGTTLYERSN